MGFYDYRRLHAALSDQTIKALLLESGKAYRPNNQMKNLITTIQEHGGKSD